MNKDFKIVLEGYLEEEEREVKLCIDMIKSKKL